ncbi:transposase [Hymenobacter sp. BRD128]|uniref:transposase n=1 Tax=Hymenobacter sp. BRD128 TaxID=2675878 RepID=UPI0015634610|nr:transposase [Hymenobacter sp. BRD128]QKG58763.1 transposase [Hymenobacter sp. BRD128]
MEKPDKRRKYDAAFKAEALRMANESRSTQAAARALNLNPKLLYKWQQDALPALPSDPAEAAEVRQLRAANKRLAQELEILKKAIAIFSTPPAS